MRIFVATPLSAVLLTCTTPAWQPGGEPRDQLERIAASIQRNEDALRQYAWTADAALRVKGEIAASSTEHCRFGANGRIVRTAKRTSTGGRPGAWTKSFSSHHAGGLESYLPRAANLVDAYVPPPAASVARAFRSGEAIVEKGEEGRVHVRISNFLKAGDSVELSFDPAADSLVRVTVQSYLGDRREPVSFAAAFQSLPDGTYSAASTIFKAEGTQLQINIRNDDFRLIAEERP